MELKHLIKVFTSKELIEKAHNHHRVKVYWEVNFCEAIVSYLSSKRVKHDPEDLKRGVGELTIEVPFKKFNEIEHVLAYAEACALVYLVNASGLNVFGVNRGHGVQKLQLCLQPSSALNRNLLSRESSFVEAMSKSADGSMLGYSDFAAAYFYGSEIVAPTDVDWVKPFIEGSKQPEYLNSVRTVTVKRLTEVKTAIGTLHITYRTVDDFVKMPLHLELAEKKNQIFTRPFESTYERVLAARSIVAPENKHLIKLKRKMGENAASLFCKHPHTFVDLKLIEGDREPHYLVVGFRPLYSQEVMDRLIEGGYAYHV